MPLPEERLLKDLESNKFEMKTEKKKKSVSRNINKKTDTQNSSLSFHLS